MPYISKEDRIKFFGGLDAMATAKTAGEANFVISSLLNDWYNLGENASYTRINEAIGVLECCKLELYRRIAVPYEDQKAHANGDVY